MADPPRYRSKTVATWLALVAGALGAHRFYLHGRSDAAGWLHPLPTLLGLAGVQRMAAFGQDDRVAWLLIPLLGASLVAAMAAAIVYGLTPDQRWHRRHNAAFEPRPSGWAAVIGVVLATALGATLLMATLAFALQHLAEVLQAAAAATARAG